MNDHLFKLGYFISHSGLDLKWKVECDALTDQDIQALAWIIIERFSFKKVVGIPTGGTRLAKALEPYTDPNAWCTLVVDDVITTGASMEEERLKHQASIGVAIFNRSQDPLPPNTFAIWNLGI